MASRSDAGRQHSAIERFRRGISTKWSSEERTRNYADLVLQLKRIGPIEDEDVRHALGEVRQTLKISFRDAATIEGN